jgi:hypothetical protein
MDGSTVSIPAGVLPSGLDFRDESLRPAETGWPPPVDDFTQVLTETIRALEEQHCHDEHEIQRLTDSNEAYKKRCHHYEKQILLYEKTIDHLIETQIRSRDW